MIRLTIPSIDEDDLNAVRQSVASGFLVQGARAAALEQAVATDAVAALALTLPLHETISPAQQQTVVDIVTRLLA